MRSTMGGRIRRWTLCCPRAPADLVSAPCRSAPPAGMSPDDAARIYARHDRISSHSPRLAAPKLAWLGKKTSL